MEGVHPGSHRLAAGENRREKRGLRLRQHKLIPLQDADLSYESPTRIGFMDFAASTIKAYRAVF